VLLLTSVALPLVFVVVMAIVEQLAAANRLSERLFRVGWDMCILALGVAGGVCLNPDVIKRYGEPGAVIAGFFSIAVSVGCAAIILLLRRQDSPRVAWWSPSAALALGGAALAIPCWLALRA